MHTFHTNTEALHLWSNITCWLIAPEKDRRALKHLNIKPILWQTGIDDSSESFLPTWRTRWFSWVSILMTYSLEIRSLHRGLRALLDLSYQYPVKLFHTLFYNLPGKQNPILLWEQWTRLSAQQLWHSSFASKAWCHYSWYPLRLC